MRGKLRPRRRPLPPRRNIPAYAKKTRRRQIRRHCPPEHPRVCGENLCATWDTQGLAGTSPRMRGKPRQHPPTPKGRRNIPAYAGKTPSKPVPMDKTPEHPRVCGENNMLLINFEPEFGTSPRMRGKPLGVYRGHFMHPEHPRVCGENPTVEPIRTNPRGTSPRMRGKLRRRPRHRRTGRNIPAYAGKTNPGMSNAMMAPEHPRVCGENALFPALVRIIEGTSPRMRGKRPLLRSSSR